MWRPKFEFCYLQFILQKDAHFLTLNFPHLTQIILKSAVLVLPIVKHAMPGFSLLAAPGVKVFNRQTRYSLYCPLGICTDHLFHNPFLKWNIVQQCTRVKAKWKCDLIINWIINYGFFWINLWNNNRNWTIIWIPAQLKSLVSLPLVGWLVDLFSKAF